MSNHLSLGPSTSLTFVTVRLRRIEQDLGVFDLFALFPVTDTLSISSNSTCLDQEDLAVSSYVTTRSRRRGRRGNAFIEAAFVLVPLFALIFAILDFGLAIFVRSTLQHAVREGVR